MALYAYIKNEGLKKARKVGFGRVREWDGIFVR